MIDFKNSKKIIFLIGGIALLFILILLFSRENNSLEYSSTFVQRGPIREEVSATGKIQPVGRIDLSFRSTGKVSKILVENGDKVKTGQVLAYLENDDLWAQLRQAQASLEAEIAYLNELKKGTREETINLKQIELSKAKQDLNNYYQTVTNTLNDAYAKSEEAIKIDTKDIFVGAEAGGGYKFSFDYCVTNEIASEATYLRLMSERELKQWKNEMAAINADASFEELISAIQKAKNHLSVFNNFFNKLNNILMADCSYSNPHLDIHRVNANHGRNLIITALSNVGKLEDNIIALNFLVEKAKNELDLLLAGSTPEQIAIQEARVKSAEANISNCYALLEKTIIRAPENGVIAKKNLREGETV
ncbi:MAG: biotin/lipoyl-binding protein, partial [Candidatus Pacebacteria bacterium]|nr:biotin/lipoyl-binding protein [Candidatus Paceibacterota bacterium]